MSPVRSGLELGVILYAEVERVARKLHLLNEGIVRCRTCEAGAALCEACSVVVINLISVSVALLDL